MQFSALPRKLWSSAKIGRRYLCGARIFRKNVGFSIILTTLWAVRIYLPYLNRLRLSQQTQLQQLAPVPPRL